MATKTYAKAAPKHLLSVAAFCLQILDGEDDSFSGIRFVDHYYVQAPPSDKPDERAFVRIWALIGFKSRTFAFGELAGDHSLRLVMWPPGRKKKMVNDFRMPSVAENVTALNFRIKLDLKVKTQGVWWLNIFLDGRFYARMPLRIVFVPAPVNMNA
jgi:hypothetical protein